MNTRFCLAIIYILLAGTLIAQESATTTPKTHENEARQTPGHAMSPTRSNVDLVSLRTDVQRLKVLLNQMRANLAFVQTSQTPLKHQFELETDAWQVLIDQMDQRLKTMEERDRAEPRQ